MIKFFIAIIFLAELVLALAFILKVRQASRFAVSMNQKVLAYKKLVSPTFLNIRGLLTEFCADLEEFSAILAQKRNEYFFNFFKTSLSYILILLLKGKYKKMFLTYQVAKEIYEVCLEV